MVYSFKVSKLSIILTCTIGNTIQYNIVYYAQLTECSWQTKI